MRALLCEAHGPPENLVLRDVPTPSPGPKQVVVDVRACSVNFPDTLIIRDLYQFKPDLPFSPGSDIAGVVSAVGEDVQHIGIGDEVFGMVNWGGFAEQVVAPASQVFPKPPNMDFETASAFMMVYATSYHALKDRADLQQGESLLVLGAAGGVGLTAVELGAKMGAHVIAAASTQQKRELCLAYGASDVIDYSDPATLKDAVKSLTNGSGVDVVYDPVGGPYSEPALRATAWKGRFLVVGFAAGDIPKIPLNLALLKGCQICGVFWGRFAAEEAAKNMANSMQLVQWLREGELKPHIDRVYSLEQAPAALRDMMERRVLGKVVVRP